MSIIITVRKFPRMQVSLDPMGIYIHTYINIHYMLLMCIYMYTYMIRYAHTLKGPTLDIEYMNKLLKALTTISKQDILFWIQLHSFQCPHHWCNFRFLEEANTVYKSLVRKQYGEMEEGIHGSPREGERKEVLWVE